MTTENPKNDNATETPINHHETNPENNPKNSKKEKTLKKMLFMS